MTHIVSTAFVEQFESEVHQAYQEEGMKLAGVVRSKTGVVGESVSFPIYGKGAAQGRGASASDVPTMGTAATQVKIILKTMVAAEYSDVFDEARLNFDDRQELAKCIGYAMRRAEDQLIIDAMHSAESAAGGASTPKITNVVPANYDDGASESALSLKKVKRAKRFLDNAGVPNSDRYFVYTPGGLDALLEDQKVGSVDYNNVKALVDGDIDTFLGFKFIMISDEAITVAGTEVKTGLPGVGTTDRTYYAFHRAAVGYGNAIDKKVMADWVAQKASYLVQSHLLANAGVLDATGCVAIKVKESA